MDAATYWAAISDSQGELSYLGKLRHPAMENSLFYSFLLGFLTATFTVASLTDESLERTRWLKTATQLLAVLIPTGYVSIIIAALHAPFFGPSH